MKRIFIVILIVFVFTSINTYAKGVPDYYVLQGEDMVPMVFHLDVGLIFDPQSRITPAPQIDTAPYVLRSYVHVDDSEMVEFLLSPVHYYPEQGMIYFVGARDRDVWQEFDHKWYRVDTEISQEIDAYLMKGRQLRTLLSRLIEWQDRLE